MERYGSATRVRWIAALTIGALLATQFVALRGSVATQEGRVTILVSLVIAAVGLLLMRPQR